VFRAEWDELLMSAREGNLDALAHLLELASEDLRSTAAGVLGRATQMRLPADDVFSDAMIAVLREIGSLRATNYAGFRVWFASIARNHVRRALRDERNRPGTRVEEGPEDTEPVREPKELSPESLAFLRWALARVPQAQRLAFLLREGLVLSWQTIGFVLERRSAPAARLVHYRCVLHMKELATRAPERELCAALEL